VKRAKFGEFGQAGKFQGTRTRRARMHRFADCSRRPNEPAGVCFSADKMSRFVAVFAIVFSSRGGAAAAATGPRDAQRLRVFLAAVAHRLRRRKALPGKHLH